MITALKISAATILLCLSLPSIGKDYLRVSGVPAVKCGSYLEARKENVSQDIREYQIFEWVHGFLVGYNAFSKHKQVVIPEKPEVLAYFDKYCREHPLDAVITGTYSLIKELGGSTAQ